MKKAITILLIAGLVLTSCASKKEKVVYIHKKSDLAVSPKTKEKVKKIISNEVKFPDKKTKEILKIIKKEKEKTKKQVKEKIFKKVLTPYKREKIEKETKLLKEPITPIKTPDVVLRILVLPYVDEDNDFHSSKFIFVKVEEGKWILGNYIKQGKEVNREVSPLVEVK